MMAAVCILLLLTGCGKHDEELDRAMALRAKLLTASVTFDAEITADYGDEVHTFSVYCEGDKQGNLGFRVTAPETIADISGRIEAGEGNLTFQDTVLAFPLLAEDQLSPVSAPWIFYSTLRGGYLTAAGMEEDLLRVTIDDSYDDDALTVDIWLDETDTPIRAEILYDGRRILTLTIENFQIL
ncbi:MAG: hypothetical protein E7465_04280 [Ruminococcaceae bacterium]|nr:hypothetical protein [Oscillospiraceae bacterium]